MHVSHQTLVNTSVYIHREKKKKKKKKINYQHKHIIIDHNNPEKTNVYMQHTAPSPHQIHHLSAMVLLANIMPQQRQWLAADLLTIPNPFQYISHRISNNKYKLTKEHAHTQLFFFFFYYFPIPQISYFYLKKLL